MTTFICHGPYIGLGGNDQSVVRALYFVVLLVILAHMSAVEVSNCISRSLAFFLRVKMAFSDYVVVCFIGS
jgi:hypothetical protein